MGFCGMSCVIAPVQPLKILAISGSLRRLSLNTALLRAASHYFPAGTVFKILDIGDLPLYNEDLVVEGKQTSLRSRCAWSIAELADDARRS